jgi:hypothetical protein
MISGINSRLSLLSSVLRMRFSSKLGGNLSNISLKYNRVYVMNVPSVNIPIKYSLRFKLTGQNDTPSHIINGIHLKNYHKMETIMINFNKYNFYLCDKDDERIKNIKNSSMYSLDSSKMSIYILFCTISKELVSYIGNINSPSGKFCQMSDSLEYNVTIGIYIVILKYTKKYGFRISISNNGCMYDSITEETLFAVLNNINADILTSNSKSTIEEISNFRKKLF